MRNTTLIYIKKDGRYLMLHRVKKQNDVNRDKWIGIGGGMMAGESPHDCAKREAFEETGLILEKPRYRGIVTFVQGDWTEYMHLFTCDTFSGTLRCDCDEGNLEWVDIDRIYELPIWEGDKVFLKLIENDNTPFFSLKLVYENDRLKESILY